MRVEVVDSHSSAEEENAGLGEKRGGDAPKKKSLGSSFSALGLSDVVASAAVRHLGFRIPTPVQRKAIPAIVQGRDVVALARTGSGKTAAFLLPLVHRLHDHSAVVGARGLVLSPTRELLLQTAGVAKRLLRGSSLSLCVLLGGTAYERQFDALAANPDIILGTPGRVLQLQQDGILDLSAVSMAVVDEADRLMELGWGEQVELLWGALPPQRQGVFVSATLPEKLVAFAKFGLSDPVFVHLDKEGSLSELLQLRFLFVRESEKTAALLSLLTRLEQAQQQALVFVSTRHQANLIHSFCGSLELKTAVVFGSMEQQDRNAQLASFRKEQGFESTPSDFAVFVQGLTRFLLVTDVAARGLDLKSLPAVVNFDFPSSARLFVHRVGRTARAGETGCAFSFLTVEELPYALDLLTFVGGRLVPVESWRGARAVVRSEDEGAPKEGQETHQSEKNNKFEFPVGALPPFHFFLEAVERHLRQDSEVGTLTRSAHAAQKLYLKTRPSASKESCLRAKSFVEESGGTGYLTSCAFTEEELLSAMWRSETKGLKASMEEMPLQHRQHLDLLRSEAETRPSQDLIQGLRRFRPKVGVQGTVLAAEVVKALEERRLKVQAVADTIRRQREYHFKGEEGGDLAEADSSEEEKEKEKEETPEEPSSLEKQERSSGGVIDRLLSISTQKDNEEAPSSRVRAVRISKRRLRKTAKELGFEGASKGAMAGTKSVASTAELAAASSSEARQSSAKDVFVDVSAEAKAAGQHVVLQLQGRALNFVGDEEEELKRKRSEERRKWDPKKRKFVLMKVDSATGLAVKRRRGTESREEKTSSAARYAQWSKATKRRIQKVGEKEEAVLCRTPMKPQARATKAASEEERSAENKLRFLPLHAKHIGIKEAILSGAPLTHKQSRLARKLIRRAETVKGDDATSKQASSLKSPAEIAKQRRLKDKRMQRQKGKKNKKGATAATAAQAKEKWMKSQRRKMAMKGAPNKSIVIRRGKNVASGKSRKKR